MKSLWKFLLWFLLVIAGYFSRVAGDFSPVLVESSPQLSVPAKFTDVSNSIGRGLKHFADPESEALFPDILDATQGKIIVSHPNGTLYLFERNSAEALWSFESGSPSSSLHYALAGDKEMSLYPLDGGLVPFQYDTSLIDIGDGHMQNKDHENLKKELDGLIATAPHNLGDGVILGGKQNLLYVLDAKNGSVIAEFNSFALPSTGDKNHSPNGDPEEVIYIERTKYDLSSFSKGLRKQVWSSTISFFRAVLFHQGREVLLPVIHLANHDVSRFLPTLQSYIGEVRRISSVDESPTDIITEEVSDKKEHKVGRIAISFLSVVVALVGAILFRKQRSTKQLNGLTEKKTVVPKRKKGRKTGNIKRSAKTEKTDENVSSEEGENLKGYSNFLKNGKESYFKPGIPGDSGGDGRTVGRLFVSNIEIAKGSNGTVVLEGMCDGRQVAVKRLVQVHHDVAHKEIQNLIASDRHPNIVRFYGVEFDSDFVYLSLERCTCSLNGLIQICTDSSDHSTIAEVKSPNALNEHNDQLASAKEMLKGVELWKTNGHPSTQLLKMMREVVLGVAHLHELGIIHRDLKPQNILITKEKSLCVKISDMGISKRLLGDSSSLGHHPTGYGSTGWQAPEQLLHGRQTRAVDLFSLGCVLFFCLTKGRHPFGDHLERDMNVVKNKVDLFLVDHLPEAIDLISHLLNPDPELRPTASNAMNHPLFWTPETRLSFLRDASDRLELEDRETNSDILKALENVGPTALGGDWDVKMESAFITNIGRYRRYKFDSMRDLLRVIRNKLNHYRELPKEIQELLGGVPEGFDGYFASRFPKFLIEVHKVACKFCMEEEWFQKYSKSIVA